MVEQLPEMSVIQQRRGGKVREETMECRWMAVMDEVGRNSGREQRWAEGGCDMWMTPIMYAAAKKRKCSVDRDSTTQH